MHTTTDKTDFCLSRAGEQLITGYYWTQDLWDILEWIGVNCKQMEQELRGIYIAGLSWIGMNRYG